MHFGCLYSLSLFFCNRWNIGERQLWRLNDGNDDDKDDDDDDDDAMDAATPAKDAFEDNAGTCFLQAFLPTHSPHAISSADAAADADMAAEAGADETINGTAALIVDTVDAIRNLILVWRAGRTRLRLLNDKWSRLNDLLLEHDTPAYEADMVMRSLDSAYAAVSQRLLGRNVVPVANRASKHPTPARISRGGNGTKTRAFKPNKKRGRPKPVSTFDFGDLDEIDEIVGDMDEEDYHVISTDA
jgi:hypothetical protein